jgi:hypothetical protein
MPDSAQLERSVLGLLCAGSADGPVKDVLVPLLRGYPWKNPLHHAIFNALAAVPVDDPATLRQLLPAKLTRMGFPDVEWEEFFSPQSLSREEAIALVQRLLAGEKIDPPSHAASRRDVE